MSQKKGQRCPNREWRQGDQIAVLIAVNWTSFHSLKLNILYSFLKKGFPVSSAGKDSTCNVENLCLIPGLERSPGEGRQCGRPGFDPWIGKIPWWGEQLHSYPLQYSDLENSVDSTVHGVANSQTQLSDFHFHKHTYIIFLNILFHCGLS